MDKQIDESNPQEPSQKPEKMIAPEDVTYSQHDEKQKAKRKNSGEEENVHNEEQIPPAGKE